MTAPIDVQHLLLAWEQFRAATDIAPIRDEAHYAGMTAMLEALLDETGGDEHHPLMGVVSEILTGKRELNLRQVRALSARFGVSAATFL